MKRVSFFSVLRYNSRRDIGGDLLWQNVNANCTNTKINRFF